MSLEFDIAELLFDREWLGWIVAAGLVVWLLVERAARRIVARLELARHRRRHVRARRGEVAAEGLLARQGYRVLDTQVAHHWTIRVDGEPVEIALVADALVERRDLLGRRRRYVAEIKTGQRAPRIETATTRRQLLEYRCAFEVDGVLLVDMEARTILEVEFPI